ncbi:BlaI/MecI/CopY family transcriptional regulator [candidate division KSB1 bacterium]|nr:BlaI/MecI/CopY family transcriptional regulator [candidate division KSB1 bacterium]NIR69287.1 BlaI/MecI/CopY family transcriptional regulator [candidate division KSB1 bacterium]NIS25722.1 BlaI/MecI/CopY family transcriptional regulator [candidate division KSB1 bacterium]NIT72578.1 BlaI/MecI/CopY family transcriptional regulator [candidate division KSB1 bacterium]NIU26407.1 BlaI/MecI/CopY family transcriptional regulator [candidate division KSB1 bacterium]
MPKPFYIFLSRREAQIMDIIYKLGEASVTDVLNKLPDPPGYNSIRVLLTILEKKGYLTHRREGQRYIYVPTELPDKAKHSALDHVIKTFFDGSKPKVVSALLDSKITERELNELSKMIEQAKRERQK